MVENLVVQFFGVRMQWSFIGSRGVHCAVGAGGKKFGATYSSTNQLSYRFRSPGSSDL
jgi:hypothetical protein